MAEFSQRLRDRVTGDTNHSLRIAMSAARHFNRRNEFLEAELETQVSTATRAAFADGRFKTYSGRRDDSNLSALEMKQAAN